MNTLRTLPIIGFFIRYWLLTLFTAFFVWLAANDTVFPAFHYVGSMVYITAIGSVMLWTTLFLRHIFFQTTLDLYAATGGFTADFNALPPERKQLYAMVYFVGMVIAFAIVAQSVGK